MEISMRYDVWINLPDGEERTYENVENYLDFEDCISFEWNGWELVFQKFHCLMIATKEAEYKVSGLKLV